ncbi:MAG TPA: alpha-ketoglutarate-dependent dioxygenase AlkB [Candidatus Acidoferrum sp.]|nr:alpha-ketoglutarate-dependent dioxygenase AlkB [Candidatus Acidoferrum sp.]
MQGTLPGLAAAGHGERIVLPDAELLYFPHFYSAALASAHFRQLLHETAWQQDTLSFGGKPVAVPRLQAWYGDANSHYGYSGLKLTLNAWTPLLATIRAELQQRLALQFNSVLLNRYRHGNDSVAWHADDERELGPDPHIASLSLGTTRRFEFKHRTRRELGKTVIDLADGSLLLMGSGVQRHYLHQIPKQPGLVGERLNLTFRFIHTMA